MKHSSLHRPLLGMTLVVAGTLAHGAAIAQYAAPTIASITSASPGSIDIAVEIVAGEPRGLAVFEVYRREGDHIAPESFAVLERAGYPHRFMDTAGTAEITSDGAHLIVRVTGLRSGRFSFLVRRTNGGTGSHVVESSPSNVMSVDIAGTSSSDGVIGGSVATAPASVDGEGDALVLAAAPMPATSQLRVAHAALPDARLRLVDTGGRILLDATPAPGARATSLDLSSIAPGIYMLELAGRDSVERTRVVVIR